MPRATCLSLEVLVPTTDAFYLQAQEDNLQNPPMEIRAGDIIRIDIEPPRFDKHAGVRYNVVTKE